MRYGIYVITSCALAIFLYCGHYAVASYAKARRFKAQEESLIVRTRLMKRQVGELEQKMRVLKRVEKFVGRAEEQRLTADNWSSYDVQIHDLMAFQELSHIVEQCIHNQNIYFRPISFHVTVNPKKGPLPEKFGDVELVPLLPDLQDGQVNDVALALKGTFMVRH